MQFLEFLYLFIFSVCPVPSVQFLPVGVTRIGLPVLFVVGVLGLARIMVNKQPVSVKKAMQKCWAG